MRRVLTGLALGTLVLIAGLVGLWNSYARRIDARLGSDQAAVPRIFARPFEIQQGVGLSPAQLAQRLDDLGYARRPVATAPGDFAIDGNSVQVIPRSDDSATPRPYRIDFTRTAVARVVTPEGTSARTLTLEAPLLAALAPGERRRYTPLAAIPRDVVRAVLAIEDRRFYDHSGVDPIRMAGALVSNLRGDRAYLVGGSTITQQIVKNLFLTPEKTMRRKLQEQFMALVLESRFTKDQILELYLNEIVLGQRGPFEVHGVSEAARVFFGKDVRNLELAEAATIAGLIQSPSRLSPLRHPERARDRRNVVLRAMVDAGFIGISEAERAADRPLAVSTRALDPEAPYFVDYVTQFVRQEHRELAGPDEAADVHTTLDLHLQRLAHEAVTEGLAQIDKRLAGRQRAAPVQVALVALDPRSGAILALIGGRAYNESQFNRAVAARRQPGSLFKPFVFLAAFERMAEEGRADLTPATLVIDEPTTFRDGEAVYAPVNYQREYEGPITLRRALALSRNVVAVKVAEQVGYDRVARLWTRLGVGAPVKGYPSIALGVFEASPLEMAASYTVLAGGGMMRPPYAVTHIARQGNVHRIAPPSARRVARPATTFLVENMLHSVMDEGTGTGARALGFTRSAAGKSGTTNDLRDAWFAGFTPELLTVVWVGFDDNTPVGLGGSQAALPIWASFMERALAGRPDQPLAPPAGVVFAEIDKDTGQLALPGCPRTIREAFLEGTAPADVCREHGPPPRTSFFSRIGGVFRRLLP